MQQRVEALNGGDADVGAFVDEAAFEALHVSLFRDAFISWEEEQELDWVVRYWEKARAVGLPVREDFGDFWREFLSVRTSKLRGLFASFEAAHQAAVRWLQLSQTPLGEHEIAIVPASYDHALQRHILIYGISRSTVEFRLFFVVFMTAGAKMAAARMLRLTGSNH